MKESSIEQAACRKAKAAGWLPIKLGQSGMPDRLFVKDGEAVFIEFKTPTGRVSKLQIHTIALLEEYGAEVYICRSVDQAKMVLEI